MTEKSLKRIETHRDKNTKIRMVATDMDGTFLKKGTISQRNIQAVKNLIKEGLEFVICTGRRLEDVTPFFEKMGIRCGVIAMNGAILYDKEGTVQREYFLSSGQVNHVVESLENWRERLIIQLVSEKKVYVMAEEKILREFVFNHIIPDSDRHKEREVLLKSYTRVTREEILESARPYYKIEIMSEDTALLGQIRGVLDQTDKICIGASFATNWEITHRDASKGAGLKAYGELCGYELSQIMALGDGDNDKTMLSLPLGWSVAMGNGTEDVKRTADVITGSNDEDGFAQAVEALLENRKPR